MTDPTFLLHVGYGKTGTSTLQRAVFEPLRKSGHIYYFGMFLDEPKDHPDRRFFDGLQAAMYYDDRTFEAALPGLRSELSAAIQRNFASLPMVLSNEHFLLSSYSSRLPEVTISAPRTAARLARVFEEIRTTVFAGLRRQDQFLRSIFVESAARSNHANPQHFRELKTFIERALDPDDVFYSMADYDACIGAYEEEFGRHPELYLFENFVESSEPVVARILAMLGLQPGLLPQFGRNLPDINAKTKRDHGTVINKRPDLVAKLRRLPGMAAMLDRVSTAAPLRKAYDLIRPKQLVPKLSTEQKNRILTQFAAGNRALAARHPTIADSLLESSYLDLKAER